MMTLWLHGSRRRLARHQARSVHGMAANRSCQPLKLDLLQRGEQQVARILKTEALEGLGRREPDFFAPFGGSRVRCEVNQKVLDSHGLVSRLERERGPHRSD